MEGLIAERRFFLEGDSGKQPVLIFRMWQPYQPEGDYPRCRYELAAAEHTERGEVSGLDFVDCIIMCLSQAGTKVAGLNESVFGNRLQWEGSPGGGLGLGLPTIEDHWPFRDAYVEAERPARENRGSASEPAG
jgi:hypothetical protein